MSDQTSTSERRAFFRLKVPGKVSIKRKNTDQITIGNCVNLSANGMLVACEQKLDVAEELEVELHSNDVDVKSLKADALVVRVNENPEGGYLIGLSLTFPENLTTTD